MAKFEWPSKNTFKYVLAKDLELEIPAMDTVREKGKEEEARDL